MEYLGLLFEIVILIAAVYLYLFSIGKVSSKDPEKQKKAEAFRRQNAGWLRLLSLALMAIMVINVFLHVREVFL